MEEWANNFGIQDSVRYLLFLWAAPAIAMLVAAAGILVDDGRQASFDNAMIFSRAWFATVGTFVLLVGAIWLVRTVVPLPSYRELGDDLTGWKLHVAALALALVLALAVPAAGSAAWVMWVLVALCGLATGSGVCRWMWRVPVPAAQPLAALLLCLTFEMTVGWLWWQPLSALGAVVLGVTTALRATAIIGTVLGSTYALAVGHWPPVVVSASTAVERVRSAR